MNILGWLFIVFNGIFIVAAVLLYGIVSGIAALSDVQEVVAISRTAAAVAAVLLSIISIPGIIVGFGLLSRAGWARVIALILGIINLFNFPLGTILGIYTLWVILKYQSVEESSPHNNEERPSQGASQ